MLVAYSGHDVGEFRDAPFRELDRCLQQSSLVHLFVDGRANHGATVDVSSEWARWLAENRDRLASMNLLSGSRVIQMTANFVKRFAALGEKMKMNTDPEPFERTLRGCDRALLTRAAIPAVARGDAVLHPHRERSLSMAASISRNSRSAVACAGSADGKSSGPGLTNRTTPS